MYSKFVEKMKNEKKMIIVISASLTANQELNY